jgi:short-subunit dehydrogenase involved in D-alanine esterification of teichoic acids
VLYFKLKKELSLHYLLLTSEYPPLIFGGISRIVRNIAQALVEKGNRVTVLCYVPEWYLEQHIVLMQKLHTHYADVITVLSNRGKNLVEACFDQEEVYVLEPGLNMQVRFPRYSTGTSWGFRGGGIGKV